MQGGSPFSASGSPGGMRRTEISNSLRPFTVAQLVRATQAHTDAEWRVDDVEIGQTTIVGQVVSIQKQTTNCVYTIDDGTGVIEARQWLDASNEDEAKKWEDIQEQQYVRVTGGLKSFGKKRYVNATHIRGIKDSHEIYFHILEAIAVSLILERGAPSSAGAAALKKTEATTGGMSAYSAQNANSTRHDQYAHLTELQQAIIHFILDQPPREEGIHVAQIAKAIGANADDARKIGNALDALMDEGHVFTTIDDSHFSVSQ
ncbi:replication protein A subunit RPA32 [Agrocybe pediades]|nr:replication protein A subunit RPA32 [Agrocybe pediades]